MKIHLQENATGTNLIRSHTADTIVVGDTSFSDSLAISPGKLVSDWTGVDGDNLDRPAIDILLEMEPELLLLGTGAGQHFPDPDVLAPVIRRQIGYEVMTTAAACRTYNVLVAEGRIVVAGLILPA
jgi:uncharacterized protein